jgi:hypothetical protein
VGIRNNTSTAFPLKEAVMDQSGCVIAMDFNLWGRDCRAISIYRPSRTPFKQLMDPFWKLLATNQDLVVAGDFNINKTSDDFHPFHKEMIDNGLSRLEWDSPTHWRGGDIDHIYISNSVPEDRRALTEVPTPFKDHTILVGGTLGQIVKHHFTR